MTFDSRLHLRPSSTATGPPYPAIGPPSSATHLRPDLHLRRPIFDRTSISEDPSSTVPLSPATEPPSPPPIFDRTSISGDRTSISQKSTHYSCWRVRMWCRKGEKFEGDERRWVLAGKMLARKMLAGKRLAWEDGRNDRLPLQQVFQYINGRFLSSVHIIAKCDNLDTFWGTKPNFIYRAIKYKFELCSFRID